MATEDELVYKQVSSWDTDEVASWIQGLSDAMSGHVAQFVAHCICGSDLLKMSKQQLDYLMVTQVGHQEILLEAVEQLQALENGRIRNSTISLASTLSKKVSQLISALTPGKRRQSTEGGQADALLSQMETAAGVMSSAKLLIHWLDRNPSSLIEDYETFRNDVMMSALDLVAILQNNYDTAQMVESCRKLVKLTSSMMLPQNQAVMEPIQLLSVTISPRDDSGLGFSIERTRQGNLLISQVNEGSPALESGLIHVGTEIVQINHQNVVGWELSKVVNSLKACGHQVTLVLKVGPHHYQNGGCNGKEEEEEEEEEGEHKGEENGVGEANELNEEEQGPPEGENGEEGIDNDGNEDDETFVSHDVSRDSSCDSQPPHGHPMLDRSTSNDLELSKSPQTPESFEGDTDFSGMQPLDLKRTASAPLTDKEKASALEASTESTVDSLNAASSCDELDGLPVLRKGEMTFEERLQNRPCDDGRLRQSVAEVAHSQLPQVAYRTQVIGGVVVRVPIKLDEPTERPVKKGRGKNIKGTHQQQARKDKKSSTSSNPEDDLESQAGQGKGAVFTEAGEVTIGGHVAKQVTVHSVAGDSKEDLRSIGGKKSTNPALLVPCFQLKDTQLQGWMNKLGGSGLTPKNWRRRWFVLKDRKLYYYKTSFDISALGIVDLLGYAIETAPEIKKKNAFKASRSNARTYFFQPDSTEEMMKWMQVLSEAAQSTGDSPCSLAEPPVSIEASDDEL